MSSISYEYSNLTGTCFCFKFDLLNEVELANDIYSLRKYIERLIKITSISF